MQNLAKERDGGEDGRIKYCNQSWKQSFLIVVRPFFEQWDRENPS